MPFFVFIDPYRTRPATGKTFSSVCHSVRPNVKRLQKNPKIPAKFASLNSSIAFGDLRLGGCLRGPPTQAPARAQSPTRNTRIKRRKTRKDFVGYFDVPESEVYRTVVMHVRIIVPDECSSANHCSTAVAPRHYIIIIIK